jgi:hypothetical protein
MIRQKTQKWKKLLSAAALLTLAIGGLAFALLQSEAKLTGNTVQTDSAGLLISRDNIIYGGSTNGYAFTHVIPGSQPSQAERLFLQNTGSAALDIKLRTTSPPSNPDNIDLSKVKVILTPYDMSTNHPGASQSFSLQELLDSSTGVPINSPSALSPQGHERFDIQIAMDGDAVNGSGTALSNLDFTFTGVGSSVN